jgi:hypothetical protein
LVSSTYYQICTSKTLLVQFVKLGKRWFAKISGIGN